MKVITAIFDEIRARTYKSCYTGQHSFCQKEKELEIRAWAGVVPL
jgi:hypothetical protein